MEVATFMGLKSRATGSFLSGVQTALKRGHNTSAGPTVFSCLEVGRVWLG